MIHALIWLPLLALFLVLGWAGWNEYQKVQAYGRWAEGFQNSKYDILSVLAREGDRVVWGLPTRKGPTKVQEVSLKQVRAVGLVMDGQSIDPDVLDDPHKGSGSIRVKQVSLQLILAARERPLISIPFTDPRLAAQWCKLLQQNLPR
ncbi:MAG: hypothetical protein H7Y22_06700 [Gemmatimonadaceae bacterium]|nr:hypothetical protein [Gloeobacterales cyanobacterium ES-bin-141]